MSMEINRNYSMPSVPIPQDIVTKQTEKAYVPQETVDIFMDNQGQNQYENDYTITKKLGDGTEVKVVLDNLGNSKNENDYHVTATAPTGETLADFIIDNQPHGFRKNDLRVRGFDLKGNFDLSVSNSGLSNTTNNFKVRGDMYGQSVDVDIRNEGFSGPENDFRIKGVAPEGFTYSPLFAGVILPSMATIPLLNLPDNVPETLKGPQLLNFGMSVLNTIDRQALEPDKGPGAPEVLDIRMDNQGNDRYENDFKIIKTLPNGQGAVTVVLDNQGNSKNENDFHVTVDAPSGERLADFIVDNQGNSVTENDFRIQGYDLKGSFDLAINNQGNSDTENDYQITGNVYGQTVDMFINNQGNSAAENDFKITGVAPQGFTYSPLFAGVILPSMATIPLLNLPDNVPETIKGPQLLNLGMSYLSTIDRQAMTPE